MIQGSLDPIVDRFRESSTRARLAVLGALAGVIVWTIATTVFPYHTINHDEGVYLQQAAMLLDGQLFLQPPVEEAFRPWFFVESDRGLYPKYGPVPAAMFAVGKLLGGYRIALALIAAGCIVLTQRVLATAFAPRTGYVGAVLLLGAPLFLVDASVFLPYVPTMFWNLAFAAAYLRANRTGSRRVAALAGLAIGIAFFSRPFTALLFALPFVGHALWTMRTLERPTVKRQLLTAAGGLLGVLLTLSYNALITGDPLLFPYEAFAPLDGLGFGRREILGYAREYTLELGVRANLEALRLFVTRWMTAGLLGTGLALLGFVVAVRRGLSATQATIAAVAVTVPLGNVYFWGTLNALGDLSDPGEGLAYFLGPYYHVDLLLPFVAFAAVGVVAGFDRLRTIARQRTSTDRGATRVIVASLLVCGAIGGAAGAVVAADPIGENAETTERLEVAYEPFEEQSLDDAIVLLPTPYGDWLNHPFQALRNEPGYDEGPVYAIQERQFAVLDAFPDRTAYRYVYHGAWNPGYADSVTPRLQPIEIVSGPSVSTELSLRTPPYGERFLVTLSSAEGSDFTSVPVDAQTATATLTVDGEQATVSFGGTNVTASVPVADRDRVELSASLDTGIATAMTYRAELPVERTDDRVRALTPELEVCRDDSLCGGEAGYVPGIYGEDVAINATIQP